MIASRSFALTAAMKRSSSALISSRASALAGGQNTKANNVSTTAPPTRRASNVFIVELPFPIRFTGLPHRGARLSAPKRSVATKHECVGCQKPPIAAGTVEVCAKVVEFLAMDLSDYVTGAV